MRAVIQRINRANIYIQGKPAASAGRGLLILLGVEHRDGPEDVQWLAGKIFRLRIFDDDQGKMNLSVSDIDGDIVIVSQFTLHASVKKGNRPSYMRAAPPEIAVPQYENFIAEMVKLAGKPVITGKFGAYMQLDFVNDGPVTILIDTKNKE